MCTWESRLTELEGFGGILLYNYKGINIVSSMGFDRFLFFKWNELTEGENFVIFGPLCMGADSSEFWD